MAIVVTCDAPEALARCLAAINEQSTSPAQVLVVDNASEPPATAPVVDQSDVRFLRLSENLGPAGGYAAGLRDFLESPCESVWLLDDDCVPRPDALGALVAEAAAN